MRWTVVIFVVIVLVALIYARLQYIRTTVINSSPPPSASYHVTTDTDAAALYEKEGIVESGQWLRLARIGINSNPGISDADLTFALGLLQSKPLVDKPEKASSKKILVLEALLRVRTWTPSQRQLVQSSVSPLLAGKDAHAAWFANDLLKHLSK